MNIRRYIDYAVKREIKRIFHRDSVLDIIKQIIALCNKDEENIGKARPALKVLNQMVEHPNGSASPETLAKNKVHFAELTKKAIDKGDNTPEARQASSLAAKLISLFKQEQSDAFGSGTRYYGLSESTKENRQNQISTYNLPKSAFEGHRQMNPDITKYNNIQGNGGGLSFEQRARLISKQTGAPFMQVLREIIKNSRKK